MAAGGLVLLAAIAVATLVPADWQIRLGLHWLVEHFLAYFAVTAIFCLAWPRPMAVAAVLLPVAVLLEAAQGVDPRPYRRPGDRAQRRNRRGGSGAARRPRFGPR